MEGLMARRPKPMNFYIHGLISSCKGVYTVTKRYLPPPGIDILNAAVEKLCSNKLRWTNASVGISTSTIKITDSMVCNIECDNAHHITCDTIGKWTPKCQ